MLKRAALRALSLEAATQLSFVEAAPSLHEEIHDGTRVVRELARHALSKCASMSAEKFAALYRARWTAGPSAGLAEIASPRDVNVLQILARNEHARIRAAGLVGLARIDALQIGDDERALADGNDVRRAIMQSAQRTFGRGVRIPRRR